MVDKKYVWVLAGFGSIILFFFILPFLLPISSEVRSILYALGGLFFWIPLRYFWQVFNRPILNITYGEPERRDFTLAEHAENATSLRWTYEANRIIVRNVGRSTAENCKGWIVTEKGKERVSWMVPKERTNATINKKDEERLDFCAYYKKGPKKYTPTAGLEAKDVPKIISPTEEGWKTLPEARPLDHLKKKGCQVLITSKNAEPAKAKLIFKKDRIKIEPL